MIILLIIAEKVKTVQNFDKTCLDVEVICLSVCVKFVSYYQLMLVLYFSI